MSNFKSGSGNLDFGGGDKEPDEDESSEGSASVRTEKTTDVESESSDTVSKTPESQGSPDETAPEESEETEPPAPGHSAEAYPYFVRRSNVGDERDTRLEIHVRERVADGEAQFRNELADHLGVNEVSKTDAREFALLVAFKNPEQVADLMREEGFGTFG